MERTYSKLCFAAMVVTTLVLGACGGGGGSGSDTGPVDGDGGNGGAGGDGAADGGGSGGSGASLLELDPSGYGDRRARIRTIEDYRIAAATHADTARITQFVSEVENALGMSGGASPEDPNGGGSSSPSCENMDGAVDVQSSETSTRVAFTDCELTTTSVPNLLLNGTFSIDGHGSGDETTVVTQYDIRGENLDTGGPISINGQETLNTTESGSGRRSVSVTSDRLEYRFEDEYVAVLDSEIHSVEDSQSRRMDVTATLVGSAIDGYLTMTTPVTMLWQSGQFCAVEGALRLEADGTVEVRYGLSTGTGDAVLVTFNDSSSQGLDTCNDGAAWYE